MTDYDPKQRFFPITQVGDSGTLSIGPRPRRDTLDEWCQALAGLDVKHVVSFIGNGEVEDYGLQSEGMTLARYGIGFTHFPIDDYGAPSDPTYPSLVADHFSRLRSGESVFAHCAGGVGRAGTFAACLLVADGMQADEAMQLVSQKRGVSSPETEGQRDFVRAFRL